MDSERAAAVLDESCARFDVPGAQLGLQLGEERIVVCSGTTEAGGTSPIVGTTPFHAGSIAKSLAAMVVLAAARRGDLDIDVPCSDQAPGLWADTPRALMSQTTGRPNVLPELDEELEDFVARVSEMPLVHRPGYFSYCNAGWSVLDLLLRRRTGRTFEQAANDLLGRELTFGAPVAGAAGHSVDQHGLVRPVPADFAAAASAAGTRWWASADELLDHAQIHLGTVGPPGGLQSDDVVAMRRAHARIPGATVADAWGLGWALWDRGAHRAFGWSGYTGGHRAFLRCLPDSSAAVVMLTNAAGPLFGPPGGSAAFDHVLPEALDMLDLPQLPGASPEGAPHPTEELAGQYGPISIGVDGDLLVVRAEPLGEPSPILYRSVGGATFAPVDGRPGGISIAFERNLLFLGPMAFAAER